MQCENCQVEHDGKYGSGRFCSSKCARAFSTKSKRSEINEKVSKTLTKGEWNGIKNIRDTNICIECGVVLSNSAKKYCSNKCQQSHRTSEYIKKWIDGKVDGCTFNGNGTSEYIRNHLLKESGYTCSMCGWDKINPYSHTSPLILDHIDGNSSNNRPDNLRIICPNCDSLTSTYKALNVGNGRRYWRYRSNHSGKSSTKN